MSAPIPPKPPSSGAAAVPPELPRRHTYHTSILRGDYFVVHHLRAFLEQALEKWVTPGISVGDVGCGEQPFRALITRLGGRYTGIDARQNRQQSVDVVADIIKVPLPEDSFDLILCSEVLEHVSDTQAAFAELTRLCKKDGAIILTTPFAYPLHEEPYDFIRLTPHQLRVCARANGLDIAQLSTAGNELEVAATVWCNIWSRSGSSQRGPLRAAWNVLMRLPVNALVSLISLAVGSVLPKKYFLSTLCILVKHR